MEARFGRAHQTELNCVRLKTRTRHWEESLAELAEDIERLVRLAYPNTTESMVEVLSKDHFLPDEEVQLRIRQIKPTTLRETLALALELESYQLASKQKAKYIREAWADDQPVQSVQSQQSEISVERTTSDILEQLVDALKNCGQDQRRGRRSAGSKSLDVATLVCWECKEKGHRRRNCPKLQKQATTFRSGNGK